MKNTLCPVFFIIAPVLLSGCMLDRPLVSPRFGELKPAVVAVLPVENRTYLDLSKVSTAGLLQRLTLGSREVDVPAALRAGLAEGLENRGYRFEMVEPGRDFPDYRSPLPDGKSLGFDAVLAGEIKSWQFSSSTDGGEMDMGGTVEIVKVGDAAHGGGEVLFRHDFFRSASRSRGGIRTPADLAGEVRSAALGSMSYLPRSDEPLPAAPASPGASKGPPPSAGASEGSPPAAGEPRPSR